VQPLVLLRGAETPAYIVFMHSELALHSIPDDELLRRLHELAAQSRRVEADLVAHIGEVDERKLYARSAFPSMFVYCMQALHLSEAEAYRRITVARAARKHAVLLAMLRDGRIHVSGLVLLVPVLTPENRDAVLERATHKSKRQIEQLVAELAPKPDVPSAMWKLPGPRPAPPSGAVDGGDQRFCRIPGLIPGTRGARDMVLAVPQWQGQGTISVDPSPEGGELVTGAGAISALELVPGTVAASRASELVPGTVAASTAPELVPGRVGSLASAASRRAVVEPLSPGRYRVQFTASAELRDQLERLAALMRSEVPDGDIAAIIQRAVAEKLVRLEARRFAKTAAPRNAAPRKATPRKAVSPGNSSGPSRHIPAAVRRAVRARDGDRCRFVDEQGRRCCERHRLEFHHRRPYGMGGDHSPENISLLCPAHNRYVAELDYGKAAVKGREISREETPRAPASA
jgi:5-methylcytosine-specific restriction endonuclease McrA